MGQSNKQRQNDTYLRVNYSSDFDTLLPRGKFMG